MNIIMILAELKSERDRINNASPPLSLSLTQQVAGEANQLALLPLPSAVAVG